MFSLTNTFLACDKLQKRPMSGLFTVNCIGSVVFSAFGFIVFTYGKRMKYWTPMLCGLALMLLPLFLADLALLLSSAVLGTAAIVFRHT
jgi:hypothetical protein